MTRELKGVGGVGSAWPALKPQVKEALAGVVPAPKATGHSGFDEFQVADLGAISLPGAASAPTQVRMAQDLLKMNSQAPTAEAAAAVIASTPGLALSLKAFEGRYETAVDWAKSSVAQQAFRDYLVNGDPPLDSTDRNRPQSTTIAGLGTFFLHTLALANDYAKDIGYAGVTFLEGSASMEGEPQFLLSVDNNLEPELMTLDRKVPIEQALNQRRFVRPTVVPPSGVLDVTTDFTVNNAHTANHLSFLAYNEPEVVRAQLSAWGYDTSTFSWVQDRDTDSQGFVVADRQGNVYLTLRGTESGTDMRTDANALLIAAAWASHIHDGFAGAIESLWPQISEGIAKAQQTAGKDGQLFITGHSLGGAMAELAALRLALQPGAVDPSKVQVYTLGAPRIGDEAVARQYNALLPTTYRMVNQDPGLTVSHQDPVPNVPPHAIGFRHVGNLVRVGKQGLEVVTRTQGPAEVDPGVDVPDSGKGRDDTEGQRGLFRLPFHSSAEYLERTGRELRKSLH